MTEETSKKLKVTLPTTLTNPPTKSLVAPGKCQFSTDFQSVPLVERYTVSDTSQVLRFGLPDTSKPLDLSTCACILAKADIPNAKKDGEIEAVIRPYTPISTNADVGYFDLLIKDYGPESGHMSNHLCDTLKVGDTVDFKHIEFNVKIQAPFDQTQIGMLVGGTGITPMLQALHAILGGEEKTNKVSMLYGSKESSDILGKDLLDQWCESNSDNLSVTHVLSHEPEDSKWSGDRGFINEALIKANMPPPSAGKDAIIFVCGPPPMYNALCGPRQDKELGGLLKEMGYEASQVYKF
eukprot:CAMPEP_0195285206 /NCGR_PEP_ID=MMETSP0707-20130614/3132_1 /TAXON_ID=33640 /ORGANISM="Asterionellopsis glacialis, Strain CCMP134" /LENGTH=294 /DNA_ID=CAMNT_0040344673 /DNA_START=30 /DNA_END=914 /DNA_ORIENTATION=+